MVYDFIPPTLGTITQGYHEEHKAIDFSCMRGSPVVASYGGRTSVHRNSRMGWVVTIRDGDVWTSYSHLQTATPPPVVAAGDVIGTCGSTGTWSTGPHVHFESNVQYQF